MSTPGGTPPDAEERRRAVAGLAGTDAVDAVGPLLAALSDPDWRVRKEAVQSAEALGPHPALLGALVAVLGPGDDVGQRNAAVEALGRLGPAAVAAVAAALPELDADGRKLAAEALGGTAAGGALAPLTALLGDVDTNVRVAAVEALGRLVGDHPHLATPPLERALADVDPLVQRATLTALESAGASPSWEALAPLLQDPLLAPRALTLGLRVGGERALPALGAALRETRGSRWEAALHALAGLAVGPPALVLAARQALATDAAVVGRVTSGFEATPLEQRGDALLALAVLGGAAGASAAVQALGVEPLADAAELALQINPDAAPLLARRALEDADPARRRRALIELARLTVAPQPELVEATATRAAADLDADVVRAALEVLAGCGGAATLSAAQRWLTEDAPAALHQAAVEAVQGTVSRVPAAVHAAAALGGWVALAASGVPGLPAAAPSAAAMHALGTGGPRQRCAALAALAVHGGSGAVSAVVFALGDEEPEVRLAAVEALGLLQRGETGPEATGRLIQITQRTRDEALLVAALGALAVADDARVSGVLGDFLQGKSAPVAVAAAEALARRSGTTAIETLLAALDHREPEVVKAVLGGLPPEDARVGAALVAALDHAAWDVRRLAADLLPRAGAAGAEAALRARLALERDELVAESLRGALAELEFGGPRARRTPPPPRGGG